MSDDKKQTPRAPDNEEEHKQNNEPINDPDEKKEKKESKGGIMPFGIVCFILEFICFVLIVVATPLDIYKFRTKVKPRACYSMWGSKICGDHRAARDNIPHHGFPCSSVNKIMTCAAAFAIISIFFTLVTCILALVAACRTVSPIVPAIFGLLCTIFLCITFACQCGARNKWCGVLEPMIRTYYKYAAGFAITVTAFALQCVVTVLLFVCTCF